VRPLPDASSAEQDGTKLSICIATFNRSTYIAETLESIVGQLSEGVELVILDGASPDNTTEVVAPFLLRSPHVRYIREATNSGVDRDFDKAVSNAQGSYCWLMSDDDVLVPGAVSRVMSFLDQDTDLLVVNSQVRSIDLKVELIPRILEFTEDRRYDLETRNRLLGEVGGYLSFIGGVVIRRSRWLARNRERFFGTLFIHVGVIFQAPLARVLVLAEPLIWIRYGNAMWTNRAFEIWMFKWPDLVWSFADFSDDAKRRVVARQPWKNWRRLIFYRAVGAYASGDYERFFKSHRRGGGLQYAASVLPAIVANSFTAVYWFLANRPRASIYDLVRSSNASAITRMVARRLNVPLT
jgi:abequosyltransferase